MQSLHSNCSGAPKQRLQAQPLRRHKLPEEQFKACCDARVEFVLSLSSLEAEKTARGRASSIHDLDPIVVIKVRREKLLLLLQKWKVTLTVQVPRLL